MSGGTSDVQATIELGVAAKWNDLAGTIADLGGTVNFYDAATRLASIDLCEAQLGEIAKAPGVVYVEVGDRLHRETPEVSGSEWWERLLG